MKKLFVLVGLVSAISFSSSAQSKKAQEYTSPLKIGIKGGANFSNMIKNDQDNSFKTAYKVGYNVGVTLDLRLLENLSFSPELLYSTKGYELTSALGKRTTITNFIDLPLLATIRLGSSINLVAGPQFSYLLKTSNTYDNGFTTIQQETIESESDRFKKSLLGGVVGFRFDINENVNFFGRYAIDFQKNNKDGSKNTPEFKNQVFSAGLGYRF